MGNLAEMSDSAKVAFLMEALEDAANVLSGYVPDAAYRYSNYVREMRGEQQTKEDSHG